MILVDAGPLIAIIDRGDEDHSACVEALSGLSPPLLTTWPAVTEAMYILGQRVGWPGQNQLWQLLLRSDLEIARENSHRLERTRELMEKYRDLPMDLADASLVAVAQTTGDRRIFTLDAHFRIYRLPGRKPFDLIP